MARGGPITEAEPCYRWVHGSRFNAEQFIAAVRPRVAIISVGAHNRYGHPSQHVIDALTAAGTRVMRTDLNGDVAVAGGPSLQVVARGSGGTPGSSQDFRPKLRRWW